MSQFANAMEVFKLLEKSNCRKCNETTCLAFASKVFLGQKNPDLCPCLDPAVLARYQENSKPELPGEKERDQAMEVLKAQLAAIDLELAAQRIGGEFKNGWLTLRIFGKPFALNHQGQFRSDLHINPWIVLPVFAYVLHCQGTPLTGKWAPFRELEGGRAMNGLFVQRGEKPLKKIADTYPGLFEDLTDMFSGQPLERQYESDISLVLYPLPKLPLLICYWKPEDGMESDLNLFFDRSAEQNGGIGMVLGLATGIVRMFEKFALTHGVEGE